MADLMAITWEGRRVGEALEAAAKYCAQPSAVLTTTPSPEVVKGEEPYLSRWLDTAGASLGVEVESVETEYRDVEQLIRSGAPALLRIEEKSRIVVLIGGSHRRVRVLGPDRRAHRVAVEDLRAALCQKIEDPVLARIESLLDAAGVTGRRRCRVRKALLKEHLGPETVAGCWFVRQEPGTPFHRQLSRAGLVVIGGLAVAAHVAQFLGLILAWWIIGRGALSGDLDSGWVAAWALLLLTMVPLQMATTWLQGRFTLGAGGVLKRRLLAGALRLDLDDVRHLGAGQLLGKVIESGALESMALTGGFLAVLALLEIVVTSWVLFEGAGGAWHALLFLLWSGVALGLVWRFFRTADRWTVARLDLTNDLVEQMVGHRTRLAQQLPERWHDGEDQLLCQYTEAASDMDAVIPFFSAIPYGWRIVGLLGLAVPFIAGGAEIGRLAVGVGGLILGERALTRLTGGAHGIVRAVIAWKRVAEISRAAASAETTGAVESVVGAPGPDKVLFEARGLNYRYPGRSREALRNADLEIRRGDRLLLTGPSGGGKSTLVSMLSRVRIPQTGLLLVDGLDATTLGDAGWRRRVVAAPQFHENHIFTGTFAFNLLMGRHWPPSPEDWAEAEEVCVELGLGDLLDRMPSGMQQMMGDTGWQLSHGEQSRVFVARALLQDTDLVILDESFGALDPENMRIAIKCARRRAKTLMIIAHP